MRPIVKFHVAAGVIALMLIATFWLATVTSEVFASHDTIATVKLTIAWTIPFLALAMAAAGATGRKLAGASRAPIIVAKGRRMAVIAANGILVLIPSAVYLAWKAENGDFDAWFYSVQVIELVAGAINAFLIIANLRAGRKMTSGRRAGRQAISA